MTFEQWWETNGYGPLTLQHVDLAREAWETVQKELDMAKDYIDYLHEQFDIATAYTLEQWKEMSK